MKERFKKHIPLALIFIGAFCSPYSESRGVKEKVAEKVMPKTPGPPPINVPINSNIIASEDSYEQCRATVMPSYINNALHWGKWREKVPVPIIGSAKIHAGRTAYKGFQAISPPSILVTVAGNSQENLDQPGLALGADLKTQASNDFGAIVVGNMGTNGRPHPSSGYGSAVHIMAPADTVMTTANDQGQSVNFGGTSGASTLVTGALAGFEWMAGYHPTAQEAKILLEKTAINMPRSNEKPRKYGHGMVNSYKMAMVGKHLAQLCGKNISCFKANIKNPAIYKFPEDPNLDKMVNQAFPECGNQCGGSAPSCQDKAHVFKKLRQQAYLNPSNRKLWRQIACVYHKSGFRQDAEGMFSIYRSYLETPKGNLENYCRSDADCVLAPPCYAGKAANHAAQAAAGGKSQSAALALSAGLVASKSASAVKAGAAPIPIAMTRAAREIHYAQNCPARTMCNNKCRCEKTETVTNAKGGFDTYTASCHKGQCRRDHSAGSPAMKMIATPKSQSSSLPDLPAKSPTGPEPPSGLPAKSLPSGGSTGQR